MHRAGGGTSSSAAPPVGAFPSGSVHCSCFGRQGVAAMWSRAGGLSSGGGSCAWGLIPTGPGSLVGPGQLVGLGHLARSGPLVGPGLFDGQCGLPRPSRHSILGQGDELVSEAEGEAVDRCALADVGQHSETAAYPKGGKGRMLEDFLS